MRIVFLSLVVAASPLLSYCAESRTGVTFRTADGELQHLYDAAEAKGASNIVQFTPTMKVLVEGGGYGNVWIETQPMGGEMFAKRNIAVALNNQLVFIQGQRTDGRLPGMVISGEIARKNGWDRNPPEGMVWMPEPGILADFEMFQGYCFPEPAWRMYLWAGKDREYLKRLYRALEAHDAYLWRTRDSNGDGLLETWCVWDTGEDGSTRLHNRNAPYRWPFDFAPFSEGMSDPNILGNFKRYWEGQHPPTREEVLVPFASMDVMAYSYSGRATLAKIARELGNGREAHWNHQAEDVRQRLIKGLWDPARHACFDRDRTGKPLPELIHNNLRVMYFGAFTQEMADAFIKHHLLNPEEFWTPLPLPSIAIREPLYRSNPRNDWSGQPQGLTYQRAIQALENYSHYVEVSLLGEKFLKTISRSGVKFTQQYDTLTGEAAPKAKDGYGPSILAALEYISRMNGIHLDVERGQVWWSALTNAGPAFSYTQRWGDRLWSLNCTNGSFTGHLNGKRLFSCTAGVRVVTDLAGEPREVVGIDASPCTVEIKASGPPHHLTVSPNEVYAVTPRPKLIRSAPFDYPKRLAEASASN